MDGLQSFADAGRQASASQPGTPYRFTFNKASKAVTVQALSSFSLALVPPKGDSFELEKSIIGKTATPLGSPRASVFLFGAASLCVDFAAPAHACACLEYDGVHVDVHVAAVPVSARVYTVWRLVVCCPPTRSAVVRSLLSV